MIVLQCGVMLLHLFHWNFILISGNICPFKFLLTIRRFGLGFLQTWKFNQPRKLHHTAGSMARRGIDQCCEDTLTCCNFRCVHAHDTSGSESRSCPRHQCHADASCTSLTSAGFQYRKLVLLRWHSVFANTHSLIKFCNNFDAKNMFIEEMTHHTRRRDTCCSTAAAPTLQKEKT